MQFIYNKFKNIKNLNLQFSSKEIEQICYRIFKYDPYLNEEPFVQTWFLDYSKQSSMLLDELFRIKNLKDESLAYRRSCREGICGSCAMNINGKNGLACTYKLTEHISSLNPFITVYPLPHMPIIKDLVICMKHFYLQYKSINPFLQQKDIFSSSKIFNLISKEISKNQYSFFVIKKLPLKENIQSKKNRSLIDGLYECILCACCSTSCPSYWWNRDKYLGPAVLLQSYRWLVDSRDTALTDRLTYLNDIFSLYRCHTILNCIKCCPKNLSPAEAIANIKSMISLV